MDDAAQEHALQTSRRILDTASTSTWFSYGSNLDKTYFDNKMKNLGCSLTLQGVSTAALRDFRRTLDNRSEQHGLAYAIYADNGQSVQGIIHKVPFEYLPKFLRMEGILSPNYKPRKTPNYKTIEVYVESATGITSAFSLEGSRLCTAQEREQIAKSKYKELREYIEAAENGARTQQLDPTPFTTDLKWLNQLCER
jgi:hypothetical protein